MLPPVKFQRQFLRRKLWAKQQELVNAVATHRSVSVKGCHGSGKTFAVAGMVPCELLSYDESIVLTIAPTLRQVKTLWNEISAAIRDLPAANSPEPSTTGWKLNDKNYALGFSSAKGVNAQGFHGKRVLIIKDEAIGIGPDIHDAIEGIRSAGDVREISLCNPTVPSGPVFDDFTRRRNTVKCITISAFDTPNLEGLTLESLLQLSEDELDHAPVPWLIRRRWVKEMYFKWGPTNPRFQSRVLGEFPTQADDSVFALPWIEKAALPYEPEDLKPLLRPGCYVQIGLDIAGPGDDETVGYARIGPYILAMEAWSDPDPRNKILVWLTTIHGLAPGAKIIVMGDATGIGYYLLKWLADQGVEVNAFVAGSTPVDPEKFSNSKAEAYFTLREWMKEGHIHGIEDEDTKAQLSDIRYRETPRGKIEIEYKDEARARGSSSPDRAEALVMAFAKITPRVQTVVFGEELQSSGY